MSTSINVSNIDILSFSTEPPLFEICGDVDKEETQWLCRDLIKAGAEPMLWGDRQLPFMVIKAGHGFALIATDGKRELIKANEVKNSDNVICLQTYVKTVTPEQLEILFEHSKTIYGLSMPGYSKEEILMMKNRFSKSLSKFTQRVRFNI